MLYPQLLSQKRKLTAIANGARIRIENAKNLIKAINEGTVVIIDVKRELIQAQADATGALEGLSDISRWIHEEIGKDVAVAADPALTDSYITKFNQVQPSL